VYADEAKTTEWAREIVSLTEMHVKVPSLTSTVDIYVDWDGVRADYAVGATYGRNAVWSDYGGVWHMQESTSALVDSTGITGNASTSQGSPTMQDVDAPFGAYSVHFTNDEIAIPHNAAQNYAAGSATYQMWAKEADNQYSQFLYKRVAAGNYSKYLSFHSDFRSGNNRYRFQHNNVTYQGPVISATYESGWNNFTCVRTTTTRKEIFRNATSLGGDVAGTTIDVDTTDAIRLGQGGSNATFYMREVRFRGDALTTNWITTEYNNQNAEATFWGTWTDAGGGPAAQAARRGVVMMM